MNTSKYWTLIGIWAGLYFGLPFLIPFFIQGTIEATDASSIGGASGALSILGAGYGVMLINLLVALGLSWTAFHRLKEVNWSPYFVVFLYCALSAGLMGTAATPFGGYHFSMFFGWSLVPAIGFLIFLGVHEEDFHSNSSDNQMILEISKYIIIGCSVFFALMTVRSGILNLKPIPFMAQIFMSIADFTPSLHKGLRNIGMSPYTLRTIFIVLFVLALAIHWYVTKMTEDEDEETGKIIYKPSAASHRQQGFGQRR